MKKKRLALIMALIVCIIGVPVRAEDAPPPEVVARAAILMERTTGRVIYAHNADEMLPMASLTKVMTALLAVENCAMDEVVTAGANASGVPGTSIYLGVGEQLTMAQMLMGLLLRSGNDAAVAIAEHIDGDIATFAQRMNARAAALGADAHFANPHGLDAPGHKASARGLALIVTEMLAYPALRRAVGTREATIPWVGNDFARVLRNKNRLLTEYDGATGVKTGFTDSAGRCLAFSAERDGMEYVGVVLNCGQWFEAATALMNWGFETYQPTPVSAEGALVTEVRVRGGAAPSVSAMATEGMTVPVAADEEWALTYELPNYLTAPVVAGQVLGHLCVSINEVPIARAPLVAGEDVEAFTYASALRRMARVWALAP